MAFRSLLEGRASNGSRVSTEGQVRMSVSVSTDKTGVTRYTLVHTFNAKDLETHGLKAGDLVDIGVDDEKYLGCIRKAATGRKLSGADRSVYLKVTWGPFDPCAMRPTQCAVVKVPTPREGELYFKYPADVVFNEKNMIEAASKVSTFRTVGEGA